MVDKIERDKMAATYGFALSFMQSDKELWALFNQAVKQTWDPNRFVAKLRDTKWFKTHSASVRNAIMQETSDPETYKAGVDQMFATARDAWGSMFGHAGLDNKRLRTWAETAYRMGWTQAQLVDRMTRGDRLKRVLRNKELGGTAAEMDTQIKQMARLYGVNLGGDWRRRQVAKLVKGNDTIGGVQKRMQDLAMREYKAFADRIAGGESVMDVAEPYIQTMASLLEMNPEDIALNNRLIQKALKQTTEDGKPAAMDLSDFARAVRQDKRWEYTDNAREEMASLTAEIARSFGHLG